MSLLAFLATGTQPAFATVSVRDDHTGTLELAPTEISREDFISTIGRIEQQYSPRWVMSKTAPWLPVLLTGDIHLAKAYVLSLAQRILHRNPWTSEPVPDLDLEERPARITLPNQDTLFAEPAAGEDLESIQSQYLAHRRAMPADPVHRQKLELLLYAESVGALIAAEMEHHGLSWDEAAHRQLLREQLGARVPDGVREPKLSALADELAGQLKYPGLNPDSPHELLRALQRAGYALSSVRAWELEKLKDPVIDLVLRYKHLSRLASAHGDHWLDTWITDSRFHPHYVLGTVASGRWAATGGGALQLPHAIRKVITAPPGKVFVVADGRQLEPRILAAISGDTQLQLAGQDKDLYQSFVDSKVAKDRDEAKLGMLSAIYGGTSSAGAGVVSSLERNFPRAMGYVAAAAQTGERGAGVHSWLGRGCPPADEQWMQAQRNTADASSQSAADAMARTRGRFTRNFVVQSTAAEWALVWMGHTRHLIHAAGLHTRCRQVFFVHDEVVFEADEDLAQGLAQAVRLAAQRAGQTLFGPDSPQFPVSVSIVRCYADA